MYKIYLAKIPSSSRTKPLHLTSFFITKQLITLGLAFILSCTDERGEKEENRLRVAYMSVAFAVHYLSVLVYTHHLLRTPAVNRHVDCPSRPGNFVAS